MTPGSEDRGGDPFWRGPDHACKVLPGPDDVSEGPKTSKSVGYGVIGNTTGSGPVILGSSPSIPANPLRTAGDLERNSSLGYSSLRIKQCLPPLCSGLARRPLTAVAPVRIRSGVQVRKGALTSGTAGQGPFGIFTRFGPGQHWGNTGQHGLGVAAPLGGGPGAIHRLADLVEPVVEQVTGGVPAAGRPPGRRRPAGPARRGGSGCRAARRRCRRERGRSGVAGGGDAVHGLQETDQ